MMRKSDRQILREVFKFFQVEIEHSDLNIDQTHRSFIAAGRKYVFDEDGKIARIVEGKRTTLANMDL